MRALALASLAAIGIAGVIAALRIAYLETRIARLESEREAARIRAIFAPRPQLPPDPPFRKG